MPFKWQQTQMSTHVSILLNAVTKTKHLHVYRIESAFASAKHLEVPALSSFDINLSLDLLIAANPSGRDLRFVPTGSSSKSDAFTFWVLKVCSFTKMWFCLVVKSNQLIITSEIVWVQQGSPIKQKGLKNHCYLGSFYWKWNQNFLKMTARSFVTWMKWLDKE